MEATQLASLTFGLAVMTAGLFFSPQLSLAISSFPVTLRSRESAYFTVVIGLCTDVTLHPGEGPRCPKTRSVACHFVNGRSYPIEYIGYLPLEATRVGLAANGTLRSTSRRYPALGI